MTAAAQRSKAEVDRIAGRASSKMSDLCYFFNIRCGVFSDEWPNCGEKRAYDRLYDAYKVYKSDVSNEMKYNALRDAIQFAETLGTQQFLF